MKFKKIYTQPDGHISIGDANCERSKWRFMDSAKARARRDGMTWLGFDTSFSNLV